MSLCGSSLSPQQFLCGAGETVASCQSPGYLRTPVVHHDVPKPWFGAIRSPGDRWVGRGPVKAMRRRVSCSCHLHSEGVQSPRVGHQKVTPRWQVTFRGLLGQEKSSSILNASRGRWSQSAGALIQVSWAEWRPVPV